MGTVPLFEKTPRKSKPSEKPAVASPRTSKSVKPAKKNTPTAATRRRVKKPASETRTHLVDSVKAFGRRITLEMRTRILVWLRGHAAIVAVVLLIGFGVWRISNLATPSPLASLFTPEVQHWRDQIIAWSERYGIDPNLIATIIQIESCGLADAVSSAGAQGLFQVMPSNFAPTITDQTEPEANAGTGLGVLKDCLRWANGDMSDALACYNGGPSLIKRPASRWPNETQRYVTWGTGIYRDALARVGDSSTLDSWLTVGGYRLCNRAAVAVGLSTRPPDFAAVTAPIKAQPTVIPAYNNGDPVFPPTPRP